MAVHRPGLPDKPQVEVEHAGRIGERRNNLALDRNGMLVDLLVKGFAEDYRIFGRSRSHGLDVRLVKPKVDPIKKMKPGPINDKTAVRLVIRPEKDRGSKYPLEAFHDPVIPFAIFEEVEEVEYLGRGAETHDAAALADGHGRYPDRNEAVLTVRDAELRMADNLKEKFAVAPCVGQVIRWRAAKWKAAKNKWPRVESELLLTLPTLLTDKQDALHLPQSLLGDSNGGQERSDRGGRSALDG